MSEELNFVRDLAIILISAGLFTIVSRALKQPLVLGYIIAGFLVGPHITVFPSVTSMEQVKQWSDIGIVFMMFALGLEFSFKKLLKVGGSAMTVAGGKFIGVFVLGYLVGQALSWTTMESIFLAGLLSMSSTAVVIKAYDDMDLKGRPYAPLVFGTLVVEDLIAIILMVLLSTMAVSNGFSGWQMVSGMGKLAFFLVLWFLVGIYVIPTALRYARKWVNDEILLIVSIGLCFGMVTVATSVGFSSALGAFVMGSILAETVEGEHIEKLVGGIKNLFSAIFFVSVGMMLDPGVIAGYWPVILLLSVVVILSHLTFAGAGAILAGKGLDNAIHTGLSLSQLGEFGFIIAGVGVSLGVMREFIYPVIIAVSVITTFTTPYMIKLSTPLSKMLHEKLPQRWVEAMSESEDDTSSTAERNEWKVLLTAYFTRVLVYGVLLVAILIAAESFLPKLTERVLPSLSEGVRSAIEFAVTLSIMTPFLLGLTSAPESLRKPSARLAKENRRNLWPLVGLILLRLFIAVAFILALTASHFELAWWTLLLVALGMLVLFFAIRRNVRTQGGIEQKFMSNLNAREEDERRRKPISASVDRHLKAYNMRIKTVTVPQESLYAGQALKEIPFRAQTGVSIVDIRRGSRNLVIPSGDERIYPGDILLAVGTEEQVMAFDAMVSNGVSENAGGVEAIRFEVVPVVLDDDSPLVGKTLRTADMRSSGCMVISVLRDGNFIANPKADFSFRTGDTVWIAGEDKSTEWFR
ncbi:MAG: cation:proton antiporter [Bacteroidales bacterium]|nr:cation:proton antiporter [Bacteroidales bacterium]